MSRDTDARVYIGFHKFIGILLGTENITNLFNLYNII